MEPKTIRQQVYPSVAQQANDFVVTSSGNVGIGTTTPSAKVEVQTGGTVGTPSLGFKLVDGNQKAGRMLTTDNNGLATWQPFTNNNIAVWEFSGVSNFNMDSPPTNPMTQETGTGTIIYDNIGITNGTNSVNVPPGKYIIIMTHDLGNTEYGSFRLSSNNTDPSFGTANSIFFTYYGDWLNTTAYVTLTDPVNNITAWFRGQTNNPSPSYYSSSYDSTFNYLKLVFYRIGE